MTKRFSSKVLAVVLTLAICATTVLGCLMTVSAAESCYSFGAPKFPSRDDLSQVSLDVTFKAPASLSNGFAAGAFNIEEVDADAEDYLTIKEVNAVTSGVDVSVENGKVVFECETSTTVTLSLVFGFSNGEATRGNEYSVKLDNVELAYNDNEYYNETVDGPVAKITTACQHVITVIGEQIAVDTANNYSVYEGGVCTLCGEEFGYQLVPTTEKFTEGGKTITWSADGAYDDVLADNGETGAENNPIIIDSVEELYSLAMRTKWADSLDKYYKLADDIEKVVLQSKDASHDVMALKSAADVEAYFAAHGGYTWGTTYNSPYAFAGHFDGNGAIFYGLYAKNKEVAGLFPIVYHTDYDVDADAITESKAAILSDGYVSISNVNITNSYLYGELRMGFIAGAGIKTDSASTTETTGLYADWCLWVDGCSVYNNYMYSTKNTADSLNTNGLVAGHFGGFYGLTGVYNYSGARCVYTKNCLIYGNSNKTVYVTADDTFAGIGVTGNFGRGGYNSTKNTVLFENLIVLDAAPYLSTGGGKNSHSSHASTESRFKNVYTNAPTTGVAYSAKTYNYTAAQMTPITAESIKGSAAIINCPNLGWGDTWLAGKNGTLPYIKNPSEVSDTIYWDGTVATGIAEGTGAENDPYIINTVSEFAYVVTLGNDTHNQYYKFADGIKNVVLQSYAYGMDILELESAEQVRAYFESGNFTPQQWVYKGWAQRAFSGKFDGNGATIYGLYSDSIKNLNSDSNHNNNTNPALFPAIDTDAEFSNLAIMNSYVYGKAGWNTGIFAAIVTSGSYGLPKDDGVVKFDNIAIINNYYRYTDSSRGAIFFSSANGDLAEFNNCLVYGNDAAETAGSPVSLAIGMKNSIKDADGNFVYASYKNSAIFGVLPYYTGTVASSRVSEPRCYSNVYTDAPDGAVYTNATFSAEQLKQVSAADVLGTAAQETMPNLSWGTEWFCGANDQPPVLAPFTSVKAGTNNVSSSDLQLVGSSVTYNDDGTLNFNLHFVPNNASVKAYLYVGTLDASKFYKLESTKSSYSDELGENAQMFTIPNLSAREIDKVWLPTVVVEGTFVEWGLTQPIALEDNAKAVLAGSYDSADKQVAAALINYGAAADEALSMTTDTSVKKTKIVYAPNNAYDASFMTGENAPAGTEDDPYIISTYGHWRYMAEKATYEQTYGKFFKVDPTIKMFVFQSESFIKKVGGLDAFLALDAQGVANIFENVELSKNIMRHNNSGNFAGTLDGSGVQIVGMSGVYYNSSGVMQKGTGGLFGRILEDATVKNLTISHTYNNTGDLNGVLIGYVSKQNAASDNVRKINIENIILHDNYQVTTGNGLSRSGLLIGRVDPAYISININGILTYDNKALGQRSNNSSDEGYTDMLDCALVGYYSTGWNGGTANPNGSYKNIITLGNAPYPVASQGNQGTKPEYWSNVYTDTVASFTPCTQTNYPNIYKANEWSSYDITILTSEQVSNLKGANAKSICSALDWNEGWVITDGYPQPIQSGYVTPSDGKTIYWDGTVATDFESGSGKKDDPFIIATASQFAYFVKDYTKQKDDSFTAGSYYKIADGIDKIVLQEAAYANDIITLSSAAEVKAYFEANVSNMHAWVNEGWEQGSFYGNFDGNGVEVYGLYNDTNLNAGLFNTLDAGAVIKNISVINSYIKSYRKLKSDGVTYESFQVAAIAPVASNSGTYGAAKAGIIWIDNCKVINNYMTHDTTDKNRCGVIVGSANNDTVYITNCLTYGNDAAYNNGIKMPLIGDFTNGVKFENVTAPEGLTLVERNGNTAYVANGIHNTIALGCTAYNEDFFTSVTYGRNTSEVFRNVYTDTDTVNPYVSIIEDLDILKGNNAEGIVSVLNGANGKTVWYVGATGEYPGFEPAGTIPVKYQTLLDAITFNTADTVGSGTEYYSSGSMKFGVYQTALSLKANPYMSFAFAFGDDYKTNRDKIKIRFTYTQDGALTTSEEIAVPAYTGEDIKNVNGWTNTTANGRFHTYKAECIPVEALAYGIKVEASYNGGAWQDFGTYSVSGLGMQFDSLSKTQPGEYYATRVEATKALLFYAQAIAARYGA